MMEEVDTATWWISNFWFSLPAGLHHKNRVSIFSFLTQLNQEGLFVVISTGTELNPSQKLAKRHE